MLVAAIRRTPGGSGDLAALIDEMIVENVDWAALKTLNGEFDDYWRITLNFLDIATAAWPSIQQERGFVDPAARQRALIERAIANVGRDGEPMIAIGSTGSNIRTARLLKAIAGAARGAVVLPGLDQCLDKESFAAIRKGDEPCATHPQAFLARLIETIGVTRDEVVALGAPAGARVLGRPFAPRPFARRTTDLWPRWRAAQDPEALNQALAGVTLIEAADEREEALTIALILREALEHDGLTAALATPDRGLAERVAPIVALECRDRRFRRARWAPRAPVRWRG